MRVALTSRAAILAEFSRHAWRASAFAAHRITSASVLTPAHLQSNNACDTVVILKTFLTDSAIN